MLCLTLGGCHLILGSDIRDARAWLCRRHRRPLPCVLAARSPRLRPQQQLAEPQLTRRRSFPASPAQNPAFDSGRTVSTLAGLQRSPLGCLVVAPQTCSQAACPHSAETTACRSQHLAGLPELLLSQSPSQNTAFHSSSVKGMTSEPAPCMSAFMVVTGQISSVQMKPSSLAPVAHLCMLISCSHSEARTAPGSVQAASKARRQNARQQLQARLGADAYRDLRRTVLDHQVQLPPAFQSNTCPPNPVRVLHSDLGNTEACQGKTSAWSSMPMCILCPCQCNYGCPCSKCIRYVMPKCWPLVTQSWQILCAEFCSQSARHDAP